ncbi:hypothetical protein RB195_008530 [Necator americanus]|uniref:Uncharacterized protein n=1 Tax=Necator americanus TaxID=51031 RepID=A0ABR1CP59_NECAM
MNRNSNNPDPGLRGLKPPSFLSTRLVHPCRKHISPSRWQLSSKAVRRILRSTLLVHLSLILHTFLLQVFPYIHRSSKI